MTDVQALGSELRAAREARGVGVRELERIDPTLARATISRIERGERVASIAAIAAYARALDLRVTIDGGGVRVELRRRRRRAPAA